MPTVRTAGNPLRILEPLQKVIAGDRHLRRDYPHAMVIIALAACSVPALRTLKLDPLITLRHEERLDQAG